MIDHLSTYATDFQATRAFYDSALAELGYSVQFEMVMDDDPDLPGRRACAWGPEGQTIFWVIETLEASSPRHIAFSAADRRSVDALSTQSAISAAITCGSSESVTSCAVSSATHGECS